MNDAALQTDDFDSVFDALVKADANPPQEPANDPAPAPAASADPAPADPAPAADPAATPDPAAAPAGGDPASAPAAAGDPASAADPAPAPAAVEPPKGESDEDLLARLAAMVKKAPEPAPAQPEPQPQPQPELYTAEEKALLDNYVKDYPDIAQAQELQLRANNVQVVSWIFDQINRVYGPILQNAQAVAQDRALEQLKQAEPDYETIRDNVEAWVETQPAYLQPSFKHVIASGTVDEVKHLIGLYKQSTGQVTQPAAAPASKPVTELPPVAKQAAQSLAPVSSKRSTAVQPSDPNDFDAAWEQAVKMLS